MNIRNISARKISGNKYVIGNPVFCDTVCEIKFSNQFIKDWNIIEDDETDLLLGFINVVVNALNDKLDDR